MAQSLAQKKISRIIMLKINIEKKLSRFTLSFNQSIDCKGITAILGVSGSGKSTLLNLINGLVKPDTGSIILNDIVFVDIGKKQFVKAQHRKIATVFQDALLFPHFKVLKNLKFAMHSSMKNRFEEIIRVLNISDLLDRYPAMLSGGEKQRVAIGRAILTNPRLLLMDEPLSALDMPRKKELINYIQDLVIELNIPILYVTHNINEVKMLANHVAILDAGRLYRYGETNEILNCDYLNEWI